MTGYTEPESLTIPTFLAALLILAGILTYGVYLVRFPGKVQKIAIRLFGDMPGILRVLYRSDFMKSDRYIRRVRFSGFIAITFAAIAIVLLFYGAYATFILHE